MGLIADARKFIDELEVKYRSSVSESTWFKIGGAINFILHRNHQEKQFFLNGPYYLFPGITTKLDGLTVFNFDAEIINVYMFNMVAGSSSFTELDIKIKPQGSGSFTSIFSTRPAIGYQAGNDVWVGVGDVIPNTTAPVLTSGPSPLAVNKGDGLVLDLINSMPGAQNCGILVHYRPR